MASQPDVTSPSPKNVTCTSDDGHAQLGSKGSTQEEQEGVRETALQFCDNNLEPQFLRQVTSFKPSLVKNSAQASNKVVSDKHRMSSSTWKAETNFQGLPSTQAQDCSLCMATNPSSKTSKSYGTVKSTPYHCTGKMELRNSCTELNAPYKFSPIKKENESTLSMCPPDCDVSVYQRAVPDLNHTVPPDLQVPTRVPSLMRSSVPHIPSIIRPSPSPCQMYSCESCSHPNTPTRKIGLVQQQSLPLCGIRETNLCSSYSCEALPSSHCVGQFRLHKGLSREEEAARYQRIIEQCGGTLRKREDLSSEVQQRMW